MWSEYQHVTLSTGSVDFHFDLIDNILLTIFNYLLSAVHGLELIYCFGWEDSAVPVIGL